MEECQPKLIEQLRAHNCYVNIRCRLEDIWDLILKEAGLDRLLIALLLEHATIGRWLPNQTTS